MPETVTLYGAFVWICVGFCVGLGWAVATWLWSKLTR